MTTRIFVLAFTVEGVVKGSSFGRPELNRLIYQGLDGAYGKGRMLASDVTFVTEVARSHPCETWLREQCEAQLASAKTAAEGLAGAVEKIGDQDT